MISSIHRPTIAKIDLDAISFNISQVKGHIAKDKKVYAVVKANAYGHGAVQVSKHLLKQVDGFCVSNLDEAIELRQSGIDTEILILGVVMPEVVLLAKENKITLTVASHEWLEEAKKLGINLSGLHVHVKVDSGMGRIGVRNANQVNKLLKALSECGVIVDGIFTHFATADEASETYFNQQLSRFKSILSNIDNCPKCVHASNSATSLWHSETIFNAVRLGIVIYGLNPSGKDLELPYPLKPALSLESELIHVKELEKGSKIGYGATYETTNQEIIGTVPIGYADGWTRHLKDFSVLVDGQYCQIVGRVSMDQITIKLPKKLPLGTKVVLIGRSNNEVITATDIANYCDTINYEVLCLLSDRIPRKY
ncbi:alanine racemase [Streptococcus urinalis FB127-CNA-2]|uniref:Alanine racemase n=1 Tax=Streptococcus urinalis 2285-97 TaxID=764291 RepID=G5KCX6_9STRE|nr:alanine racemase [Streptococcus urinalis]EHJ57098.1 alanine racemase [Streptococcus urinalis 2285-97]EKS17103.1 alanine racemase [Streptococcus urinalis FB127-CNA-2]VEF32647.1 Alanine racemase [Streptococcus urinalis]